jgi:hypothetical protein
VTARVQLQLLACKELWKILVTMAIVLPKVLKNGRGRDRGRVKVVAISAVTDAAIQITVFAV